ncbi:MAG: helix-turn-helix transcriptional regulator [Paracoccaceae bacterium]
MNEATARLLADNLAASALLTDREAAEFLGMGRSTFWRYVGKGELPQPLNLGHLTRWRRDELQAVIDQATAERDANEAA